jgi:hypothetical protein
VPDALGALCAVWVGIWYNGIGFGMAYDIDQRALGIGHRALGIGHRELGIGHRELGIGH